MIVSDTDRHLDRREMRALFAVKGVTNVPSAPTIRLMAIRLMAIRCQNVSPQVGGLQMIGRNYR